MKKLNVLLVLNDPEYADALARALVQKDSRLSIAVGNNDRIHSFEGIVVQDIDPDITGDNVIYLDYFAGLNEITRFICDKGALLYGEFEGRNIKGDTRVVCVTGSSGGSGVTSICEGLAQELSVYYSLRPCVISLSLFPDTVSSGEKKDIRQLMYHISVMKENGSRVPDVRDYFAVDENGVYHPEYGKTLNIVAISTSKDVMKLISFIAEYAGFDYIILDIPGDSVYAYQDLFDMSDEVVLIRRDGHYKEKHERISAFLSGVLCENSNKMIVVENFSALKEFSENIEAVSDKSERECETNISEIRAYFDEDIYRKGKISVEGVFGLAVKNIALKLNFC